VKDECETQARHASPDSPSPYSGLGGYAGDVESREYKVKVKIPWLVVNNEGVQSLQGKAQLKIYQTGLSLTKKHIFRTETVQLHWAQLRELTNELKTKRQFRANLGGTHRADILITVKIVSGDLNYLDSIFAKLPDSAYTRRCSLCGGTVRSNICASCGQDQMAMQRKRGRLSIFLGAIMVMAGILSTGASYLFASPGDHYFIFYGLVIVGALSMLAGMLKRFGYRA